MANPLGRRTLVAAAALLIAGFGGGFLTARLTAPPPSAAAKPDLWAGIDWPLFGKPRAPDAPRQGLRKPDGFAVWTSRLDVQPSGPRACIRMTRPLDPRRSYGDFVTLSPDLGRPPAVSAAGDELCVAGVGYDSRTVTLLHGLPDLAGETLQADADVAFEAGSKPPYVGFVGAGVILPREDADGVGLESVNVSRLHVEVWRVADRNLVRKTINAPDPTAEAEYEEEDETSVVGEDGRKVWSGDMAVHGQADQRATTVFPLGAVLKTLQPGAYVVSVKDASGLKAGAPKEGLAETPSPARAWRWILFTDMALQAYDGSDALDVTVRSLKSATPMAGVRIALVGKDGGDLAAVTSDSFGHAHFPRTLMAGEAGAAPSRIMAYGPEGDFTVMELDRAPIDLSKQDVSGRVIPGGGPKTGPDAVDPSAQVDGFLYADRGIYRPGETAHLVALLRDRLARSVKDRRGALVVRRPSGLEFSRLRFAASANGAVSQDLVLPPSAPRGVWRASLEMEGSNASSGEMTFQVEDFVPQRLAVTLAADAERPLVAAETRQIQVSARFLYGAAASSLAVRSEGRVIADPDPFPAFKGYRWGDEETPFPEKLLQGPPSLTDGSGHAVQVLHALDAGDTPQPLLAMFTASVFEPGGRPVSEEVDLRLRQKPLYLGVKTTAGSGDEPLQTFDVIAVDALGRRVAASKVHYKLVSERWSYDWYEQSGRWAWRRTQRDIPLAEGTLDIGQASAARLSKRLAWGDYRLELEAGGAKTVIRQSAGWGAPAAGVEPPDTARVSTTRTGYRPGDTVEVRVDSPFAGQVEIAVATDRLIAVKSAVLPKAGGTFRLKTDAAWGGGAYVLVTVVQPRDPVSSPKPRRALGLVYVPLEPSGRTLTVALNAPALLDSKAPLLVPLQVKGLALGAMAHVTLAAVDEGVLRLTHHKAPDPAKWYFGKRALGLTYRDDYGRLLDPNLGAPGAVNVGGDEVGGAGLTVVPTKTVALWSGIVETDASGRATIRLPPGDMNGQLRLMAVAWTDKAVGSGVSDVTVRQPVVAELSLPRFLAPGDHIQATLELDNVAGRAGAYQAALSGLGGLTAPPPQTFTLAQGARITQPINIAAPLRAGVGALELKASGPGFSSDRRYPIQTRLGWGPVTHASFALQKPGEAYTPPPGTLNGFAPGGLTLTVSYSPFRGLDPGPIAAALSRYPYGCSEQLTSSAMPLLYAAALGVAPKIRYPAAALSSAVGKLLDREALDGSFGLWRVGDGEADPWLGAYIVDFLLEAKARGAAVPDDALTRALSGMRLVSRPDGFSAIGYVMSAPGAPGALGRRLEQENVRRRSRAAAYALYDLAKAKAGDLGRLRWFHDVGFKTEASPLARAEVGAGLAAMGDRVRAHDSFLQAVQALGFKDDSDWYQSPLRDLAGVVALAYEADEVDVARSLQRRLEDAVRPPDDLNTQEQAQLLKAADAMMRATGPVTIQAAGTAAIGPNRFAVGRLADARFVNRSPGAVWRMVTVSGVLAAPPRPAAAGMRLDKQIFTLEGGPADPLTLKQGQRVIVRLSARTSDQNAMQTVVDDPLPAGLEIEAVLRPVDAQGAPTGDDRQKPTPGRFAFLGALSEPSVQEMRDDRYVAAFPLDGSKPVVLAYVARAVTPGAFFLPGAEARNMYRPRVNAQTAAGRMTVSAGP